MLLALLSQAATAKHVAPSEATAHLIDHTNAIVPPLAKAMRLGGTVTLEIVVSAEGNVISTQVIDGSPILQQAAVDAVKQWKYTPFFDNGVAVSVVTVAAVDFGGGMSDQEHEIRAKLFPAEDECRGLLNDKKYAEAGTKCRETVQLSDQLPKEVVLERSTPRSLLAHSVLLQGRVVDAIQIYEEALTLDKPYLGPNDADLATDYANLARAYALNRQFEKSDSLYATAVETFEAAIKNLPDMKENYQQRLNRTLLEYAQLKDLEGQGSAASELRKKASPH
jgi:TonB family protein